PTQSNFLAMEIATGSPTYPSPMTTMLSLFAGAMSTVSRTQLVARFKPLVLGNERGRRAQADLRYWLQQMVLAPVPVASPETLPWPPAEQERLVRSTTYRAQCKLEGLVVHKSL